MRSAYETRVKNHNEFSFNDTTRPNKFYCNHIFSRCTIRRVKKRRRYFLIVIRLRMLETELISFRRIIRNMWFGAKLHHKRCENSAIGICISIYEAKLAPLFANLGRVPLVKSLNLIQTVIRTHSVRIKESEFSNSFVSYKDALERTDFVYYVYLFYRTYLSITYLKCLKNDSHLSRIVTNKTSLP